MASKFIKNFKKMSTQNKIIVAIVVIVIILVLYSVRKRIVRNRQIRSFDNNQEEEVNQITLQYRATVNSSGISWMIGVDGTIGNAITKLAYRTKERLQAVANAYRLKFNESLSDRMRWELSPEEYQDWTNIID